MNFITAKMYDSLFHFIVGSYMVSLTWLKFVSFASEPRLHFKYRYYTEYVL